MKRLFLIACLLALGASPALGAGGVNLTWGTGCWADVQQPVKTFACDTNVGSASFVGSFAPTGDIPDFVAISVVLDGKSDSATLPDWWQVYNAGSCRQTALSVSAEFATAPGGCADPWQGLAVGGIGAWQTQQFPPPPPLNVPLPDRCRLKLAYVLVDPSPLVGGTEYYGFRATINYARTVGPDACAGCPTGVVFLLNELDAIGEASQSERITNELNSRCLNWNRSDACHCTAARSATWGRVKGLYR